MDHLDQYEAEGVDDDVEEELDEAGMLAARAEAEAELNRRDRKQGKRGARGMPGFLAGEHVACMWACRRQ